MGNNSVFAVFDLETNGFKGASTVSASSIVFTAEGEDRRLFQPFLSLRKSVQIIGPSESTGSRRSGSRTFARKNAILPTSWRTGPSLAAFWERWNPEGIVVHNLSFRLYSSPRSCAGKKVVVFDERTHRLLQNPQEYGPGGRMEVAPPLRRQSASPGSACSNRFRWRRRKNSWDRPSDTTASATASSCTGSSSES